MSDSLLPTLPGEAVIDDELVADVVARLNATLHRNGLETARTLGRIVLDAFFGGNPTNFRDREKGHLSFRQLAARDDLQMSHVALWNAVALVEQLEQLPPPIGNALSVSHHRVLLALHDPDTKRELAQQAVDEQLSKRALAERVRLARHNGDPRPRGGRPPRPTFVKALKHLESALQVAGADSPTPETFRAWGLERSRAAVTAAEAKLAELQAYIGRTRDALDEVTERP